MAQNASTGVLIASGLNDVCLRAMNCDGRWDGTESPHFYAETDRLARSSHRKASRLSSTVLSFYLPSHCAVIVELSLTTGLLQILVDRIGTRQNGRPFEGSIPMLARRQIALGSHERHFSAHEHAFGRSIPAKICKSPVSNSLPYSSRLLSS